VAHPFPELGADRVFAFLKIGIIIEKGFSYVI
jgi:hypothetical protein